ncbi:MAG: alpha/beta hydrolase [Chitinophagaceae bacterium]|nr:alpha/beta hydrolase [Oligoflexus sp.]
MTITNHIFAQLKGAIPQKIRNSVGSDIYGNYTKLRAAILGADIRTFGDDHKIEYALVNRGKPERVVFLHGFADCKENFYDAAHMLVPQYDLLIPDLPGFGKSFKKKKEIYNLENYVAWLAELFKHVGYEKFHLIGNSLGGAVAIEIALRMPHLVKSLTLIDPAGIVIPEIPSIYDEFLNDRIIFEIHSPIQFDYFLNRVFHRPPIIPPFVWDHLYQEFSRHSTWNRKILFDLLEGVKTMKDPELFKVVLNDQLKDIVAPTLILWGEKDSFFPAQTGHLVRREIHGSQLHFLPGLGHSPQNEAPIRVMRIVRSFLKGLKS